MNPIEDFMHDPEGLRALQAGQQSDAVNLPSHYARFPIEPILFIVENKLGWFAGNIVKYILRWDAKNGREDLKKAARYLAMWIKFLDGDKDWWKRDRSPEALIDEYQLKLAKVCAQNEELREELRVIKEGGGAVRLRALRELAEREVMAHG